MRFGDGGAMKGLIDWCECIEGRGGCTGFGWCMKSAKKVAKGLLLMLVSWKENSVFTCGWWNMALPAAASANPGNWLSKASLTVSNSKWESSGLRGEFDCFAARLDWSATKTVADSSELDGEPQFVTVALEAPEPESPKKRQR
jgi:hypothetical protein